MHSSMRLKDKVVVVTGGNSGIGYATAKSVIDEGGIAVIAGRNKDGLDKAAKELEASALNRLFIFSFDQGCYQDIGKLSKFISDTFGELHGIVLNAGVVSVQPYDKVSENSFDEQVDINFKGSFFVAQKAAEIMKAGGSIVFNASYAAYKPFEGGAVYSATKAALKSLAASMAVELAKAGIRVNSVSPGNIDTPIFDKLGLNAQEKQKFFESIKRKVPLGRSGKPDEIAKVITFLLSDESSYITGTNILVDGGLVLS